MNFKLKCIVCGTGENLQGTMNVKNDKGEFDVSLCAVHSEEVTMKQVKELVQKKLDEFEVMKTKMMEEYGIDITKNEKTIMVVTPPAPVAAPVVHGPRVVATPGKPKVSGEILKEMPDYKIPVMQGPEAGAHHKLDVTAAATAALNEAKKKGQVSEDSKLPEVASVEMQTAEGRLGVPMKIPKQIVNKDGSTTRISVVKTSDKDLQDNFRKMSSESASSPHQYSAGYALRECTLCNTTGITRISGETCPKCKGKGYMN